MAGRFITKYPLNITRIKGLLEAGRQGQAVCEEWEGDPDSVCTGNTWWGSGSWAWGRPPHTRQASRGRWDLSCAFKVEKASDAACKCRGIGLRAKGRMYKYPGQHGGKRKVLSCLFWATTSCWALARTACISFSLHMSHECCGVKESPTKTGISRKWACSNKHRARGSPGVEGATMPSILSSSALPSTVSASF